MCNVDVLSPMDKLKHGLRVRFSSATSTGTDRFTGGIGNCQ